MQKKEKSVLGALNYIFSRKEKAYLLYITMLVIIGGALETLAVAVFTPFIEVLTGSSSSEQSLVITLFSDTFDVMGLKDLIIKMAIGIIIVYILKNAFLIYEKNSVYKFSYGVQQRVAKRLIKAYLHKPYQFHLKTNPAELVRTIQVDADNFTKAVIHVIELVMEFVVCAALVTYLFIVSPLITLVIAAFLSVAVVFYIKFSKSKLHGIGKQNQKYVADIYKYLNESFGGIKEIKVLGREDFFIGRFFNALSGSVNCLRISRLASVLPKYFIEAVCIVGLMVAVIIEVSINSAGLEHFIPQLAVFATAAFRLMPSVGRINEHTAAINTNAPSINLIYNDLRSVQDEANLDGKDNNIRKLELKNSIEVAGVTFSYQNSERIIIDNVSFNIPKGKTVAFIGESGAGKTTIIDLILGVLSPEKGKIVADEIRIDANISAWQKNIGYIPQTIFLSDDTIRNNIAFGIEEQDIDENAVAEAVKKAQLSEFIKSLPDGLETVVGERGARISGGQRQRIGIARALYHDPEILVLDEATSALDSETETAVMEAIDGLHGMKTMLIIAHRLSTIRNADIIYEVGNGNVVERRKEEVL